jgi:hypothetical protein
LKNCSRASGTQGNRTASACSPPADCLYTSAHVNSTHRQGMTIKSM